jgi:hypothetical protein
VVPDEVAIILTLTEATLFGTVAVYVYVVGANAGDNAPELSSRDANVLAVLSAAARFAVMVYVLVLKPSPPVHSIAMVLEPTATRIHDDLLPDKTGDPLILTLAADSVKVGVTRILLMLFTRLTVYTYVVCEKESVPDDKERPFRVASAAPAAALMNVIVYVKVVTPSWATTTIAIALFPTARACAADVVPERRVAPATVKAAGESVVNGFIVTDCTALTTVAVYEKVPAANDGERVPELISSLLSVASV